MKIISCRSFLSFLFALYFVISGGQQPEAVAQVQIVPPQELQSMRSIMPSLADKEFDKYLRDSTTMWYTVDHMPVAYQHANGNGYVDTTFHWAGYNISADPTDQPLGHGFGGNANIEFPWSAKPGGAHRSQAVDSFKGLWLPKKQNGSPWPVVWFRRDVPARGEMIISTGSQLQQGPPSAYNRGYGWAFPIGTVFVEALTTRDPEGYYYVFEVRFRIREADAWGVEIFRPFPSATDLSNRIKSLRPEWRRDSSISLAVAQLDGPPQLEVLQLADKRHTRLRAFDSRASVEQLPSLPSDLVNELLTRTTFKSSLGQVWRSNSSGPAAFAPSNEVNEHNIVPPGYDGTFIGTDRESCMKCHESTNQHATAFEYPRGWYGRVRGSDGILSWHPVEPASVARNGFALPVRMRSVFVQGGILAPYSRENHPSDMYTSLPGIL